jgi:hypothetical protein
MWVNTESLLVANTEVGLEGYAETTKYMSVSREQTAGRRNIKTDIKSFEMVEQFKYFGTTPKIKNCLHKEIKSRLN